MKKKSWHLVRVFGVVLFVCCMCCGITVERYIANPGKSALAYLHLPLSARYASLGGAVISADGEDVGFCFMNPALTGLNEGVVITASMSRLTLDRRHYFGGLTIPFSEYHFAGCGWVHYGVYGIERRDINGIFEGSFADQENTFSLWYCGGDTSIILGGISLNYHGQVLDSAKANGFSVRLGGYYRPLKVVKVGLVVHDLGFKMKWSTGNEDPLAPGVRIGSSISPYRDGWKNSVNLLSDLDWVIGNFPQGHWGVEGWVMDILAIRIGAEAPNPVQIGFGIGIHFSHFYFDYCYVYHESEMGDSHLGTISCVF